METLYISQDIKSRNYDYGVAPPVDKELFTFACKAAENAAQLTLKWFQNNDLTADIKSDGTEVTDADRSAEDLLRSSINKEFPNDTIIGEEVEDSIGSSHQKWIIDPIDGTASFVRGVPLYSSLLAVIDEHGPAIGIINLPALGESLIAGRGLGAYRGNLIAEVSKIHSIAESCVSSSSFDQPWWPREALLNITSSGAKIRTWGDGYGYFLVGTGRIEAMIDPSLYTYDIAAMLTIIPECGGKITTWSGETELEDKKGWVASNGLIHKNILEQLNQNL